MENKGLLFIPDISGFSRFVSQTEIEHSRMIIQELLETLINANHLGLEISEIEGDAILFYKFGDPPDLEELYRQVEDMFRAFHNNLTAYDLRKYCQCKACLSAVDLTLKVITHYGEFAGYNVKNFNKLIGKDIIIAHQLLKNDIDQHEYWLVTQSLLPKGQPEDFTTWMKWNSGGKQTESGKISFQYTQLSELKNGLSPEPSPKLDLANKVKVITVSGEYDTDIITLFHATGDFNYRRRWKEGVKKVEEVSHFLPRVGMKCRSTMENGEVIVYSSSSYYYSSDRIEFSETEESRGRSTYYTLQSTGPKKTKLTLDFYLAKSFVSEIMFSLTEKNKMKQMFSKSMQNLTVLAKEIRLPS